MNTKKAFTLVELIVVINILAILATIAFISVQGFNKHSRNSVRVSNLSLIKSNLSIFKIEVWNYPTPDNPINVTYSWWLLWQQWTFWDSAYTQLWGLSKRVKDPLFEQSIHTLF